MAELLIEKKPFEGTWWKYGLGLALAQMIAWVLLGRTIVPSYSLWYAFSSGAFVYGAFIFFSLFPFVAGRLGLKFLMWFALVGFAMGDAAYFLLALYEPTRRIGSGLLPFVSFMQLIISLISLGIVIELGRFVFKRVFKE